MIIGTYKIDSTPLNVVVSVGSKATADTKTHVKGEMVYKPTAYLKTVKEALKWLLRVEANATGLEDLQTVVNKIDSLEKLIDNLDLEEVKEEIHKPTQAELDEFFGVGMEEEAMD